MNTDNSSKGKVLIGMSGGVDSSVAAYLLKKQGYEVVGLTLEMWSSSLYKNRADFDPDMAKCVTNASRDAKMVADKIGIEHRVLNYEDEFKCHVVDYFTNDYINGRTPNPCIECNKFLKFGKMLDYALENGFNYVATGHYATVEYNEATKRYVLKKSVNDKKDQTYVLYTLSQKQLSHIIMPLGDYTKDEIRKIAAEEIGMYIAKKSDSMEICFIPDDNYIRFIKEIRNYTPAKGKFVDKNKNVLGEHDGIINFTIGQRKGLGITFGKPMFVTDINPETNDVTLGEKGEEYYSSLTAVKPNFISMEYPDKPFNTTCKTRYSAKPCACTVTPCENNTLSVVFETPQRAVTPGQSVVFYDENIIVGGGVINKVHQ